MKTKHLRVIHQMIVLTQSLKMQIFNYYHLAYTYAGSDLRSKDIMTRNMLFMSHL